MKKILLALFILISGTATAQDSVIANLQLRARTIKLIAILAKQSDDTTMVKTFLSWNVQFKATNPNDNANVTIASALAVDVGKMYSFLLSLPVGLNEVEDFVGDFKTSIQPFRVANAFLDAICDELEATQVLILNDYKTRGQQFLLLQ